MTIVNSPKMASSSRRIYSITVLTIVAVLILFITASLADITEIKKLVPGDGAYADYFGSSVSISGEYAIVGAPSADTGAQNAGAAYIFEHSGSTWSEVEPRLVPSEIAMNEGFGSSVSIAGDSAIVGKPFAGAAYVFRRTGGTWTQEQKLTASDHVVSDYFGTSVSIAADYAIVGAPYNDDNGSMSGSAYIFERSGSTWTQVAKLTASDGEAGDRFGISVSISGNYAIVGAPFDDNLAGTDAGSVYFYRRVEGIWEDEQKLVDPSGDDGDAYGWAVDIYGKTAIIGAYGHNDDSGDDVGSAVIAKYWNDTWLPSDYLMASDRAPSDSFGYSVSISATYVIIGAFNGDGVVDDSGAAYVFVQTSGDDTTPLSVWEQMAKLIASDGAGYDRFGGSVSISGPDALVGAKWDNNSAGSAYIFDILGQPSPSSSGVMPGIPLLLLDE